MDVIPLGRNSGFERKYLGRIFAYTLCMTTHQSTKFTNRSNYLHHPHRYQPMPILKFSIFIIPAQVKQREKKRKGGNNVEERRETWRIAFAFSKMAANLKFVLGP